MPGKIILVSQHYPPDSTTTAGIVAEIANHLAKDAEVLVLSGTPGSAASGAPDPGQPSVAEVKNRIPAKGALVRRAVSEALFTLRVFVALVRRLRSGDVVITVTAPFMLPYASVAAGRCRGARSVLILHDLFPVVMLMSDMFKPRSLSDRALRLLI